MIVTIPPVSFVYSKNIPNAGYVVRIPEGLPLMFYLSFTPTVKGDAIILTFGSCLYISGIDPEQLRVVPTPIEFHITYSTLAGTYHNVITAAPIRGMENSLVDPGVMIDELVTTNANGMLLPMGADEKIMFVHIEPVAVGDIIGDILKGEWLKDNSANTSQSAQ